MTRTGTEASESTKYACALVAEASLELEKIPSELIGRLCLIIIHVGQLYISTITHRSSRYSCAKARDKTLAARHTDIDWPPDLVTLG